MHAGSRSKTGRGAGHGVSWGSRRHDRRVPGRLKHPFSRALVSPPLPPGRLRTAIERFRRPISTRSCVCDRGASHINPESCVEGRDGRLLHRCPSARPVPRRSVPEPGRGLSVSRLHAPWAHATTTSTPRPSARIRFHHRRAHGYRAAGRPRPCGGPGARVPRRARARRVSPAGGAERRRRGRAPGRRGHLTRDRGPAVGHAVAVATRAGPPLAPQRRPGPALSHVGPSRSHGSPAACAGRGCRHRRWVPRHHGRTHMA